MPAVRREVKRLQLNGVNILIAIGHSGHSMDKKIAQEVDGIDLVIGGHTNTFLYSGTCAPPRCFLFIFPTLSLFWKSRYMRVAVSFLFNSAAVNIILSTKDETCF